MSKHRLNAAAASGKAVIVANLGLSACSVVFGSIVLSMACSNAGGEGDADSSESGADPTGDPTSAASSDDGAEAPVTTADDGTADDDADDGATETGGVDEDIVVVPLRIEAFEIPTGETNYNCFEFSFTLDQLGHVVEFVPMIDNAPYVHHFVLSKLESPTGQTGYQCFDLSGEMVWTWAPGGEAWKLPPEAGFLIGDAPGGEVHFRLQVHYNNPLGTAGLIDGSGLDLHVAKTLRPNDAGTMVFGDIAGISIPPGMAAYEHVATCSGEATASLLVEPMHIFGSAMHAHDIGSVLWSDVNRGGEFMYELNRDEPYLFDSQHMNPVDFVIEPGDEVVNHCIYDSSERTSTTNGGPGTLDEMCWNVVNYWPRIANPVTECGTFN